ncbi:hypothetical protein, partial [Mesobacillus campisalis]
FQYAGLQRSVNASGLSRSVSWTQWSYLERSFYQLQQLYSKIQEQPLRELQKAALSQKGKRFSRPTQPYSAGWSREDMVTKFLRPLRPVNCTKAWMYMRIRF